MLKLAARLRECAGPGVALLSASGQPQRRPRGPVSPTLRNRKLPHGGLHSLLIAQAGPRTHGDVVSGLLDA